MRCRNYGLLENNVRYTSFSVALRFTSSFLCIPTENVDFFKEICKVSMDVFYQFDA